MRAFWGLGLALFFGVCGLSGCAPAPVVLQTQTSKSQTAMHPTSVHPTSMPGAEAYPFQADFSDVGVTWVSGGRAYVARAPDFVAMEAPLPTPATAVAWAGDTPWAALSDLGLVIALDGPVQQLRAPQVWKLSHTRMYTRSGAAISYSGLPVPGFPIRPQAVVTGTDGQDYALIEGRIYRQSATLPILMDTPLHAIPCPTSASPASVSTEPYLYATPTGAAQATCPVLETTQGFYRLSAGTLEQLDAGGAVLRSVPYPVPPPLSAAVGRVGEYVVALRSDGQLRAFMPDLREVSPQ